MQNNEQNLLISKIETDSENRLTVMEGVLGVEELSKREKSLVDMDNSEVIAKRREI